jgi:hypothetical protein
VYKLGCGSGYTDSPGVQSPLTKSALTRRLLSDRYDKALVRGHEAPGVVPLRRDR